MDEAKFSVGEEVVIFTNYGREFKKTKVSDVDIYSISFESGEKLSQWNLEDGGRKVVSLKDIDLDQYERMVLTKIMADALKWRKNKTPLSSECLNMLKKEILGDESLSTHEVFNHDDLSHLFSMGVAGSEGKVRLDALERLKGKG